MIKAFEGYRRKAAALPGGGWTIGYGHTRSTRPGAEVSETDAEALLIYDLIEVVHVLNEHVHAPLSQNQFDALASFVFNVGVEAFRGSAVFARLNEGAMLQAAGAMEQWRVARFENQALVVDVLVRRRAAEKALFLTPPGAAWKPAPSPVLRPLADPLDGPGFVQGEAAVIEVPLEGDDAAPMRAGMTLEPSVTPRPFAPGEPEPHAEPAPPPQAQPAPVPPVQPNGDGLPRFPLRTAARPYAEIAPMVVVALLGAALFAGGLYWTFDIAPEAELSRAGTLTVGWLAGLAGVGFFSFAVYRLFERLAGDQDDLKR